MFSIIEYHKNILVEFNKVKNDNSIPLREKGIAYSSNRNVNEVITAVKNFLEPTYRLLKDKKDSETFKELKKILTTIDKFEENPYEVIVCLSTRNKHIFEVAMKEAKKRGLIPDISLSESKEHRLGF